MFSETAAGTLDSSIRKKYNAGMKTNILCETPDFLVCEKPAGLAVQAGSGYQADMVSELKNYLCKTTGGRNPYLGVIHRLDQPVEGLLVFARTEEAAADLSAQLAEGRLTKRYLAVLEGIPGQSQRTLVDYVKKDGKNRCACVTGAGEAGAKRAELSYRILAKQDQGTLALAEISLRTGRFHQIRVQMAHRGWPIVGDGKYGAKSQTPGSIALCARELTFYDGAVREQRHFSICPRHAAFGEFSEILKQ